LYFVSTSGIIIRREKMKYGKIPVIVMVLLLGIKINGGRDRKGIFL
jgi:hypothetical protein